MLYFRRFHNLPCPFSGEDYLIQFNFDIPLLKPRERPLAKVYEKCTAQSLGGAISRVISLDTFHWTLRWGADCRDLSSASAMSLEPCDSTIRNFRYVAGRFPLAGVISAHHPSKKLGGPKVARMTEKCEHFNAHSRLSVSAGIDLRRRPSAGKR